MPPPLACCVDVLRPVRMHWVWQLTESGLTLPLPPRPQPRRRPAAGAAAGGGAGVCGLCGAVAAFGGTWRCQYVHLFPQARDARGCALPQLWGAAAPESRRLALRSSCSGLLGPGLRVPAAQAPSPVRLGCCRAPRRDPLGARWGRLVCSLAVLPAGSPAWCATPPCSRSGARWTPAK